MKPSGKVCTMTAQQYVDEEEDLDDAADSSVDMLTARGHGGESNVTWLRNVVRRNTQVAPDGKLLLHYDTLVEPASNDGYLIDPWTSLPP